MGPALALTNELFDVISRGLAGAGSERAKMKKIGDSQLIDLLHLFLLSVVSPLSTVRFAEPKVDDRRNYPTFLDLPSKRQCSVGCENPILLISRERK